MHFRHVYFSNLSLEVTFFTIQIPYIYPKIHLSIKESANQVLALFCSIVFKPKLSELYYPVLLSLFSSNMHKGKYRLKINGNYIWKSIEPLVFGIAIAILIKTLFIQAYIIPSTSMMDTLLVGDCLIANKVAYNFKIPFTNTILINIGTTKRYDIIVFKYPKNKKVKYIKRVIGLPGESVELKNNKTLIDGILLKDDFAIFKELLFPSTLENFGPVLVPKNHVFVMGDNRNNSSDSRVWGFVNTDDIIGKAAIIYWSWDKTKKLPRIRRLFNVL